jgi:hypothetical protein
MICLVYCVFHSHFGILFHWDWGLSDRSCGLGMGLEFCGLGLALWVYQLWIYIV